MFKQKRVFINEYQGCLDNILELPDISRPIVTREEFFDLP
jgi:hypothetical protein